jgi:hypothetical protein
MLNHRLKRSFLSKFEVMEIEFISLLCCKGLVAPVLATKEKPLFRGAVRGNYQGVIWFLL